MLIDEFQSELARFKTTKVASMSSPDATRTPDEINTFEREHGFRFPPQYRDVATNLGTGEVGLVVLFSVGPGDHGITTQRALTPALPTEFAPVSDNGCGDFYGYLVRDGQCQPELYLADHESEYELSRTEFADLYEYLVRYAFKAA